MTKNNGATQPPLVGRDVSFTPVLPNFLRTSLTIGPEQPWTETIAWQTSSRFGYHVKRPVRGDSAPWRRDEQVVSKTGSECLWISCSPASHELRTKIDLLRIPSDTAPGQGDHGVDVTPSSVDVSR